MPTTELLLRRARKALCRGSRACEARWTRSFLAGYALLGRDPAQTDENLYRYCFGAPTDGTDPSGLQEFPAPGQSPGGILGQFEGAPGAFDDSGTAVVPDNPAQVVPNGTAAAVVPEGPAQVIPELVEAHYDGGAKPVLSPTSIQFNIDMTYNAPVNGMIWYQTVTEWCFVFDSVSQSVAQQVTGSKVEDLRYINGPFRDRIVRGQSDGSNAIRKEANFCYLAFYEAAKWGVYRNATIDSTLGNGIDYTPGIGAMDGYHNEVTQKVLLADRHVSDDGSYQLPNRDWDSVPKSNITAVYPQGAPLITGGWTYTSMVGRVNGSDDWVYNLTFSGYPADATLDMTGQKTLPAVK